jgi:FkbM family methyltransferase
MILRRLAAFRGGGEPAQPPPIGDPDRSYSQEGEDRVLIRWLAGVSAGYFVDVGAHHPSRYSNTALLYEQGWHGINVDPMPGTKAAFDEIRSRDTTIEVAVGSNAGPLEYFVFDDPALNTLSRERVDFLTSTTNYQVVASFSVPVMTLAELLDTYLPNDQAIDLLNVDVEGLDLDVLRSNDWARYRPRRILVEDWSLTRLDESGAAPTVRFLRSHGYVPVAKTIRTVFFGLSDAS